MLVGGNLALPEHCKDWLLCGRLTPPLPEGYTPPLLRVFFTTTMWAEVKIEAAEEKIQLDGAKRESEERERARLDGDLTMSFGGRQRISF